MSVKTRIRNVEASLRGKDSDNECLVAHSREEAERLVREYTERHGYPPRGPVIIIRRFAGGKK
jgi:hypothetical protein